jgi:uncharacterized protein YbbC (DUF1343 family)
MHRNSLLLPLLIFVSVSCNSSRAQAQPVTNHVKLGIDVLREDGFKILQNKRVGLVAHPASVDSRLVHTVDVLRSAPGVKLVAIFGPEHGVWGDEAGGDKIPDRTDPRTGLPVYSLYGATRKPSPQVLAELDALVFDLQDIGSRSYTYVSTMKVCLEACSENAIEFIVLDRPNPLGGERIEGPPLKDGFESFIGALRVPYVHGMTMGELAQFARDEVAPGYRRLRVVKMQGWTRDMTWADTNLAWVPTSPHIPQVSTTAAYSATGILGELHAVSIGVGYTLPFEIVGAPEVNADELAEGMNKQFGPPWEGPPGLYFRPARFKPFFSVLAGEACQGVQVHLDPKRSPTIVEINFRLIEALGGAQVFERSSKRHGSFDRACGSDEPRKWIMDGKPLDELFAQWRAYCEKFRQDRGKWLLY